MKKIVTIDAGTSNLRIRIVEGKNIIFERKINYFCGIINIRYL